MITTTPPTFPRGARDSGRLTAAALSSYWIEVFGDPRVFPLFSSLQQANEESLRRATEALRKISRKEMPVFETWRWYCLTLLQSDRNDAQVSPLAYDGTSTYSGNGIAVYGQASPFNFSRYPAPTNLINAKLAASTPGMSGTILSVGIDFQISVPGTIDFYTDPFSNPDFGTRSVVTNGQPDLQTNVWLAEAEFDTNIPYEQFGFILGLNAVSSEAYKQLINAYWDGLMGGMSDSVLRRAISAATGIPLIKSDEETVDVILSNPFRRQVVTDKNVYDLSISANVSVTSGQQLYVDDVMCSDLEFVDSSNIGTQLGSLSGLTLGRELIDAPIISAITFQNAELATSYSVNSVGQAVVRFPVLGQPGDVTAYWNAVTARETAGQVSVASTLRMRPKDEILGLINQSEVFATVNPMKYVIENYLEGGITFIRINTPAATGGVGLGYLKLLRQLVPPHMALIFITSLSGLALGCVEQYNQDSRYSDGIGTASKAGRPAADTMVNGSRYSDGPGYGVIRFE